MTIELRPLGVKCNLRCHYCYQNPQRDAGNILQSYDISKMKEAIEKENGPFSIFGGEPFLIPERDLEDLWSWGFRKWKRNSVQTNATLINENHINLFKKYNVHVGISIDGPGELNDLRWAGTLEITRLETAKTEAMIERLRKEGISTSIIVTLHRKNATIDKLPILVKWIKHLEKLGVTSLRLHILETENESQRQSLSLSTKENIEAFLTFAKLEKELKTLKFDVFNDMRKMLLGDDQNTTCVWNACDPYTTRAVRGIEGNGQRSNCGRTNKDGIDYVKSDMEGFERYFALYNIPQEYGGCKDCKFFLMCKGQCPGTSINGDWRNKTEYCEVWKTLYQHFEDELIQQNKQPISNNEVLREYLENALISNWLKGNNQYMFQILNSRKTSDNKNADINKISPPISIVPHHEKYHLDGFGDLNHDDFFADHTDGNNIIHNGELPVTHDSLNNHFDYGDHVDIDDPHSDHVDIYADASINTSRKINS